MSADSTQQIQVPREVPCPLPGLSVGEVETLLYALNQVSLPRAVSDPLVRRIEAMAQVGVQAYLNPPPPLEPKTPSSVYAQRISMADAQEALRRAAEDYRRTGDGTLVIPLDPDPLKDYAPACSLIGGALQQLDEGLPNRQKERVLCAYTALKAGTELLGAYLDRRFTLDAVA